MILKYAYNLTNAADYLDMSISTFRKEIKPILLNMNAIDNNDKVKRVRRIHLEEAYEIYEKNRGEQCEEKPNNTKRQAYAGKTVAGGSTKSFSGNTSTPLAQRLTQSKPNAA